MMGKRVIKGITAALLAMMVLLGSSTAVLAADSAEPQMPAVSAEGLEGIGITPDMLYANKITQSFDISSAGYVSGYGSVLGYQGTTTRITMYLYLEKYSGGTWVYDGSWSSTTYSYTAYLPISDTVSHGYTYRLRGVYYVYSGTAYERTVVYSPSEYY